MDFHKSEKQNEAPEKKHRLTLTFRSLGTKFLLSIWYFLNLHALVLFFLAFVSSGGLQLVFSSSFFSWSSFQDSCNHIIFDSLRHCHISTSIALASTLSTSILYIALPSHCSDIPLALRSLSFDTPLLWHPQYVA